MGWMRNLRHEVVPDGQPVCPYVDLHSGDSPVNVGGGLESQGKAALGLKDTNSS